MGVYIVNGSCSREFLEVGGGFEWGKNRPGERAALGSSFLFIFFFILLPCRRQPVANSLLINFSPGISGIPVVNWLNWKMMKGSKYCVLFIRTPF